MFSTHLTVKSVLLLKAILSDSVCLSTLHTLDPTVQDIEIHVTPGDRAIFLVS